MTKVILFTLNGCGHCEILKNRLNELSIKFDELEINKHPKIWDEIVKDIKYDYLPTTLIINGDHGEGLIFVPTINYHSEDEIVDIIKKHVMRE